MTWIDIVIFAILVGGLLEGFLRGLIKEVIGVLSVAVGIYVSRLFGHDVAIWLNDLWHIQPAIAEAVAYALVFAVISFAVSFASHILSQLVQMAHLSTLNRLLGAAAGFVKALVVALVIVFALSKLDEVKPILSEDTLAQSKLYKPTLQLAHDCLSITRSQFEESGTDD